MKRAIKRNIQRNTYIEGVVRGNKGGYAFLQRADGGNDLFLPHNNLGGAQHGDTVKVRLVKGDEAEVVKIVSRGINKLSGEIYRDKQGTMLRPDLQSYYSQVLLPYAKGVKDGDKAFVEIVEYQGNRPVGKLIRKLGKAGAEETEILSCLFGNGFSDSFPVSVEKAAADLRSVEFDGRKDLRDLLTVTIDGEDARDFDDAISVYKEKEHFVLWVHIADVSAYVRPNSAIDREAYQRGTSVYFPKKAYPMLPEKLSNDLCSLREGEDKATVSVKMVFDKNGDMIKAIPYLSVIKSNHRMTYTETQAIFDGNCPEKYLDVLDMLTVGRELANILNVKRKERGSIDFGASDGEFAFEGEEITAVIADDSKESNRLIEAFMIAANEAVASLLEDNGYPCVFRTHEEPTREKLKQLTAFAGCFIPDMPEEPLKPAQISKFIDECNNLGEAGDIIAKVAVRCMQKAKYSPDNIGHYGLASDCYCHFTSPIRRYPDLLVHRILKRYLRNEPYQDMDKAVDSLRTKSENCSERERAAERAERDISDYYKAVYMAEHVGEKYQGMISGVTAFALFVTLPNGVEGSIRVDDLPDSYYLDDLRFTLVGDQKSYRLGDEVEITVLSSDVNARKVYFAFSEYLESGIMGKEGYIEGVGVLNPLDVDSIKNKPSQKKNTSNRKNGVKRYAKDHKPPKKKRRR